METFFFIVLIVLSSVSIAKVSSLSKQVLDLRARIGTRPEARQPGSLETRFPDARSAGTPDQWAHPVQTAQNQMTASVAPPPVAPVAAPPYPPVPAASPYLPAPAGPFAQPRQRTTLTGLPPYPRPAARPPAPMAPSPQAPLSSHVAPSIGPALAGPPLTGPVRHPGPAAPPRTPAPGFKMNENFLGHNLLPILASVLGLAGLIYLGILVVPHFTDPVKIILMFGISLAVGGLGYYLNRKRTMVLTAALMGTGVGGVFISILVTHLYFRALNDVTAFALLAVWIVVSMWLAHHVGSLLIAILAHAGMVASITTAYLMGFSDDKLVLLMVYQVVATVAIIVGNMVWTRAMYRFGLFASQTMIIVCVSAMWHRFMGVGPGFASGLPTGLIVAAFLIQFLGATAIAYLLFVSCARVKDVEAMGVLSALNSVMWLVVLVEAVTVLCGKLSADAAGLASGRIWSDPATVPWSLAVSLVLAFLPVAGIALAGRRVGIKPVMEYATIIPLTLASVAMLLTNMLLPGQEVACPWISVLAAAYLLVGIRSRACSQIGLAALILDALIMLLPWVGYDSLTDNWGVWVSLGYLVVLVCLGVVAWRQVNAEVRSKHGTEVLVGAFFGVEVSLARIIAGSSLDYKQGLFVVVTTGILIGIHILARSRAVLLYRIVELATILVAADGLYEAGWRISRGEPGRVDILLASCAAVGLIVILVDRIRGAARATSHALRVPGAPRPDTRIEILSGIGLTVAAVGLLTPYDWFVARDSWWPWGFPTSLACMVVALIIVGLGLWARAKPLRLYGLVVVIICVLKLVTLDLGSVNSITRVVAFLGGAAVCFGISALYNYAARHFDKNLLSGDARKADGQGV